jgi:raffinose/stachyose/melibiose transport system substrate-binding protein
MSLILVAAFVLSACATATTQAPAASEAPAATQAPAATTAPTGGGEVYYLNFKPEVADIYTKIAEAYKAETGITLKVVTAAAGTYEQTLKSEIAKSDPPVLFQINGPRGYANWKDYCADLSNTDLYKHLTDKSLAVTSGGGVYGIPYVVEGYGIIYNNAVMDKYFALSGAKATSMADINNFATLKAVVEDMTAKKDQLGIKGVFLPLL